jgi:hypothetical protein
MRTQVRVLEVFALYVGLTVLSGFGGANNSPPLPDFTLSVSPQSLFLPIGVGSSSLQVSVQIGIALTDQRSKREIACYRQLKAIARFFDAVRCLAVVWIFV